MVHNFGVGRQHPSPSSSPSANFGACFKSLGHSSCSFSLAADVSSATSQGTKQNSCSHPPSASSIYETYEVVTHSAPRQHRNSNKLHCSYPLRLRQRGYVTLSAPTITQRAGFRNFETLKELTLRLQRRVAMLRSFHRFTILTPSFVLHGSPNPLVHRKAPQSIVLCQPPTLQIHSPSRHSLLASAPRPT